MTYPVYLYTLPSHKGPGSGVARVCGTQYALFGIRDFRHSLQRQRVSPYEKDGVYIRCHLIQRVPREPRAVEPRVPRGQQVLQVDDSLHFHFR